MPLIQLATFSASEEFASSQDIFKESVNLIKGAEGYKGSFYGLQVEDKKIGYFISVWESSEHRQKLVKASYADITEKLKPAVGGQFETVHANVSCDPNAALSSPVVAVGILTLKAGGSADKLRSLLEELGERADTVTGARPPCIRGQSIEDKSKFLVAIGWDSLEVSVGLHPLSVVRGSCPADTHATDQGRV
ncbi:hypothetical protein DFH08DRAFT_722458 [Mycena albidolilacea]|uniref:ABM domain-containing protein n=1 Tax=Mycena albidolilacea TaxID=1033008 RepID=A0AAD6Z126_9AGAR|nr:hypothetical protein DFH08DRAFT_722458 [Mycena albidolilacea]